MQTRRVDLSFEGESVRSSQVCAECGREYVLVRAFVRADDEPAAVVFAACHLHNGQSEVWFDVAVGSFDEPAFIDQVTFSCVVRSTGASLMTGPVATEGKAAFFGSILTADQARSSGRLDDFWRIVDYVVTTEPTVAEALYGTPPR